MSVGSTITLCWWFFLVFTPSFCSIIHLLCHLLKVYFHSNKSQVWDWWKKLHSTHTQSPKHEVELHVLFCWLLLWGSPQLLGSAVAISTLSTTWGCQMGRKKSHNVLVTYQSLQSIFNVAPRQLDLLSHNLSKMITKMTLKLQHTTCCLWRKKPIYSSNRQE